MSSLILELQQAAMNTDQGVTDVLRKALVVATKLGLTDFQHWCELEMNGYQKQEVPQYRIVRGELKAFNPYNGWIPVMMENTKTQERLSKRAIGQAIGELEDISSPSERGGEGSLQVPLAHDVLMKVFGKSESFQLGMVPTLLVGKNQVVGILEAVRNQILTWSLELEKQGVFGEGLTFSKEEVQKASTTTVNVAGSFSGVIGDVSNAQLQIGDYNGIHAELKKLGIAQKERNELEEILDELPTASGSQRDGLLEKGTAWIMRNTSTLGKLAETISK